MKHPLCILASTKNNNPEPSAKERIAEIYHILKQKKEGCLSSTLLLEALRLKKIPEEEIKTLLSKNREFSNSSSCLDMSPTTRLFCFPYAGGLSSIYESWQASFPDHIAIHKIEYPGRGTKSSEHLIANLDSLLSHLAQEIMLSDSPFTFFGHSLGAIVAYELSVFLKKNYTIKPFALFLSGCPSPETVKSFSSHSMNDQEFIQTIQDLNGTPSSLLQTNEFKNFFLPILRNDFSLLNTYTPSPQILDTPFIIFGGNRDPKVPFSQLEKWKTWTTQPLLTHEIEGDHFFIHHPQKVIEKIKEYLCKAIC